MPITILDIILLAVMFISALLAMVRGFMREILSIASWAAAAAVTLFFYKRFIPMAEGYFPNNQYLATGVVVAGLFFGTLIVVSIITIKISDMTLDSRIGALDRTLGFLFGLARGLLIVVVAFTFFDWLVPQKAQPKWITEAKSWAVLQGTGNWLVSISPDLEAMWAKYKQRQKDLEGEPPLDKPANRSDSTPLPQVHAAVAWKR